MISLVCVENKIKMKNNKKNAYDLNVEHVMYNEKKNPVAFTNKFIALSLKYVYIYTCNLFCNVILA